MILKKKNVVFVMNRLKMIIINMIIVIIKFVNNVLMNIHKNMVIIFVHFVKKDYY